MKKEQLNQLAEMVRSTSADATPAVILAVKYHLSLFLWGIETSEQTLNAILIACNSNRNDNIVQRLGIEELEKIRGKPIIVIGRYSDNFIVSDEKE